MFKKKLLLLITEIIVILKYLDQLSDQLCDSQSPPSAKINNRSFVKKKQKKWYNFFSVSEKITILLFERNKPTIKMLFKDASKP